MSENHALLGKVGKIWAQAPQCSDIAEALAWYRTSVRYTRVSTHEAEEKAEKAKAAAMKKLRKIEEEEDDVEAGAD